MIEGHGDDIYGRDIEIKSNFSTNIFCKRNIGLEAHLQSKIGLIYNYPAPDAKQLREKIAKKEGLGYDSVLVTSGVVEAIYLIAKTFNGHSAILSPTFSEYEDACRIYNHEVSHFHDLNDISSEASTIWICNPNNPDGRFFPNEEIERLLTENNKRIVVMDQAYEDYTEDKSFPTEMITKYPNAIILKSITKKFSLPGLRIGYLVAAAKVADVIRKNMMPWSVNSLAIEAAAYCLDKELEFKIDSSFLRSEIDRLKLRLADLGISSSQSRTNFLLCRLPKGSARELKEYLINNYGILIRDASNFSGLTARHFRVAALTPEENDNLINAIKSWL